MPKKVIAIFVTRNFQIIEYMKSMMLTGIREMLMKDISEPIVVKPDDVKIKMSVAGVCGSDIHYYTKGRIGFQKVSYPFTVGHEGAGIVVETGVSVKKVKKGDLIAIEPSMPCHECDQCLAGRPNTCRKLRFLGCPGQADGCLSEYIVIPEKSCYRLPENLSVDHGAISEPLSIGVYSVRKYINMRGARVGILGFGPIGMCVMLAAKSEGGTDFFITDKIDQRLSIARKEGVTIAVNVLNEDIVRMILDKEPLGLDVVFECCGQQEAFDQAVELLKPGGRIIVAGIPEFDTWSMNVEKTRRKEITIQFVRRQIDCMKPSLEMMKNGKIDISNMITHRFPFEKTREAFELVADYRDGVMKAMVDF